MTILIADILQKAGITHITPDSRQVKDGSAFFAVDEEYIDAAVENGAKLIVCCNCDRNDVVIAQVSDVRIALAEAARYLYPAMPKHLVAVTGTSGKTSIVNYFMQICGLLGNSAASIGSVGIKCTDKKLEEQFSRDNELTTPDIISMHKVLSKLKESGVDYVAFEASSHGLDQKRIYGIKVEAAAFTNISDADHLDYHGTMEAYMEAKMKLFSENLEGDGRAVVSSELLRNCYSREGGNPVKAEALQGDIIIFESPGQFSKFLDPRLRGDDKVGNINIIEARQALSGQEIEFGYLSKNYKFKTPIIGSFQASNILMAASMADKVFGSFDEIVKVLPEVRSAAGRLERVTNAQSPFQVIVDYSYKPDALEKVLLELRALCEARLLIVFGCGGDRNKEKRPIMGRIAAKLADIVIITDDNPRTEDPEEIRRQIAAAAPGAIEVGGREEAISYAIKQLQKGDILLIAGKGHEDYQLIGDKKIPFDDCLIAKKYIGKK